MPEKVEIKCICGHEWVSGAKPENRKCPKCGLVEDLVIGEVVENEPQPKQKPKKASKAQRRETLLKARLVGPNVSQYSLALRKVWRLELQQIAAGTWKGPIRARTANKVYEDVVG